MIEVERTDPASDTTLLVDSPAYAGGPSPREVYLWPLPVSPIDGDGTWSPAAPRSGQAFERAGERVGFMIGRLGRRLLAGGSGASQPQPSLIPFSGGWPSGEDADQRAAHIEVASASRPLPRYPERPRTALAPLPPTPVATASHARLTVVEVATAPTASLTSRLHTVTWSAIVGDALRRLVDTLRSSLAAIRWRHLAEVVDLLGSLPPIQQGLRRALGLYAVDLLPLGIGIIGLLTQESGPFAALNAGDILRLVAPVMRYALAGLCAPYLLDLGLLALGVMLFIRGARAMSGPRRWLPASGNGN